MGGDAVSCVSGCLSVQVRDESPQAGLDRGRLTLLVAEFQTLRSLVRVGSLAEAEMFPQSVRTAQRLVELGLASRSDARYSATERGERAAAAMPFAWTDEIVVVEAPEAASCRPS